jgi:hypothetical protein
MGRSSHKCHGSSYSQCYPPSTMCPQGPQGPQGPRGPRGPQGETGPSLEFIAGPGITLESTPSQLTITNSLPSPYKQVDDLISPITTTTTSAILCGLSNIIDTGSSNGVVAGTRNEIKSSTFLGIGESWNNFIGGGVDNKILPSGVTAGVPGTWNSGILAGVDNLISSNSLAGGNVILGGSINVVNGVHNTITGGTTNFVDGGQQAVVGGTGNRIQRISPGISGNNFIGGGELNVIRPDVGVELRGPLNSAILGGKGNLIKNNWIIGNSVILGGIENLLDGSEQAIVGGNRNQILQNGGGESRRNFIGGGLENIIEIDTVNSSIIGGLSNRIRASNSVIVGGQNGVIVGRNSFMFNSGLTFQSTLANQFNVKAHGGTRIFSNDAGTNGVQLITGAGSWSTISDRNLKENIIPTSNDEILEKIIALPIYDYNFIGNPIEQRCVGPMAQDWYLQFPCEPTTAPTVDPLTEEPILDEDGNIIYEETYRKNQLSIEMMDMVGNIMCCVKELSLRNKVLEDRILALENSNV